MYRFDTEDKSKVTGQIEAIDGSGANAPFKDMAELGAILSSFVSRQKKLKEKKAED